ncbi:MAG: hypothetical protein IPJ65_32900 [Archangiaceae bacterium]|nr:hypothetical protein [Archangiaceae bacterium]
MRPQLALVLYALLVISGAAALWAQRNPTGVPVAVARAAPWVFLGFAVGFAVYRFALVTSRHYSAFKAFFQIAVAFAVFFLLLNPGAGPVSTDPPRPANAEVSDLPGLMADGDPRVRMLAAEVARYRTAGPEVSHAVVKLLSDPDERVRGVAHQTLVQFNSGEDLGTDPKGWAERFP